MRPKVLVVDDEEDVRNIVTELVEMNLDTGVDAADSGWEALKKIEASGPYDLIICDVKMPNMSGLEFSKKVLSAHPQTKIALMSGYTEEPIKDWKQSGFAHVFKKPFDLGEMDYFLRSLK